MSLTLPTGQGVRRVNALRRAVHEYSENWVISLRPGDRGWGRDGRRTGASGYGLPAFVGTDRSVLTFPGEAVRSVELHETGPDNAANRNQSVSFLLEEGDDLVAAGPDGLHESSSGGQLVNKWGGHRGIGS